MSVHDAPLGRRLRRPSWRDPRLGVGLLLVAGSVALGTWAVQDAADTEAVYVATEALVPGTTLSEDNLDVVQARPPGETYLRAEEGLPAGAVLTRVVGAGEMVPRGAVGRADEVDVRPVVVPLGTALPVALAAGAVVDLWFTAHPGITTVEAPPSPPELLVPGAVLSGVVEQDSVLTTGAGVSVELLVPGRQVATVLAALAQDGELVVVPAPGAPAPAGGSA